MVVKRLWRGQQWGCLLAMLCSAPAIGKCVCGSNEVRIQLDAVYGHLTSLVMPLLPELPATVGDEPEVFMIEVSRVGDVCSITPQRSQTQAAIPALVKAIEEWRFLPVKVQKVPVCFKAKIYAYIRKTGSGYGTIFPGLTDVK